MLILVGVVKRAKMAAVLEDRIHRPYQWNELSRIGRSRVIPRSLGCNAYHTKFRSIDACIRQASLLQPLIYFLIYVYIYISYIYIYFKMLKITLHSKQCLVFII